MGRLSQLFGLKKSTGPSTGAIPTTDQELALAAEPWQGNLPCVHGNKDGCDYHNPRRHSVFFDPLLFPASEKFKPSGNHRNDTPPVPLNNVPGGGRPSITSSLPRSLDSGCLSLLPRVHKSVPYSLGFYHLHHMTSSLPSASDSDVNLTLNNITCTASTGSNPRLFWTVRPILSGGTTPSILLQYNLSFSVEADLGTWSPSATSHGRAISKVGLIGSGYKEFTPCLHTKVSFRSHKGEGKHHVRTAAVSFSRKVNGAETKEEWSSDSSSEIKPMGCTKCFTDAYLDFEMLGPNVSTGGVVLITVTVNKDLGSGDHPSDQKWLAAIGAADLQRDVTDLGRIRRCFAETDGMGTTESQGQAQEEDVSAMTMTETTVVAA